MCLSLIEVGQEPWAVTGLCASVGLVRVRWCTRFGVAGFVVLDVVLPAGSLISLPRMPELEKLTGGMIRETESVYPPDECRYGAALSK